MLASINDLLTGLVGVVAIKEDEEVTMPLNHEKSNSLMQFKKDNKNTVDAETVLGGNPKDIGRAAFSMWPGAVEVNVPQDWKLGDKVPAQGPHGLISFELPDGCQPGTKQLFTVKPVPDMRVEVPAGVKAGQSLFFQREDGMNINILVPRGKFSGDTFEVVPPAVMVLVPEEAKKGDVVCFPMPGPPSGYWFSAVVPDQLQLGKYFAARLPPPSIKMQTESPYSPTCASQGTGCPSDDSEDGI